MLVLGQENLNHKNNRAYLEQNKFQKESTKIKKQIKKQHYQKKSAQNPNQARSIEEEGRTDM